MSEANTSSSVASVSPVRQIYERSAYFFTSLFLLVLLALRNKFIAKRILLPLLTLLALCDKSMSEANTSSSVNSVSPVRQICERSEYFFLSLFLLVLLAQQPHLPRMNYFRAMALLTVSGVSKKEKEIFTVKDISFTQQAFQKIAIAGETGSGKTTLLKMIAGLSQPDAGQLLFEGKKVRGPNNQLIPGHAGIAYLSQHFELRNNYWVHEILSYANELSQQEADTLYKVCRIDHLLGRRTDQLSGGEKQRIALTRLLIGKPRLLLLDEPFSNLDAVHKTIIKSVTDDINTKLGISCIMVSHDAPDVLPWADTVFVMKEGQLIQQAAPEQIYRQPVNEYCAGLFGEYNLINAEDAVLLNTSLPANKKLLVRPEEFIVNATDYGLEAIVQKIFFMGSYYTIVATTANSQSIKIRTVNNEHNPGDIVKLSIADKTKWFI